MMDEKIFSQFITVPLRQPVAVKGLHTWPDLYTYILEELERCAKQPSYLSMFKESPSDTNPFNTSTFDIIKDRLKGTDTNLDIVSGELVLNTNKFHYKEDSLNKNTLYKLQWDIKSYNTLKDVKIPEFFNLVELNKSKYVSLKEQFGNFNLVPVGLHPSLYDLRIANANKKRIRGLCNILEKIENLYKTTYVDFTNSITSQIMGYRENIPSFEDFISVNCSLESLQIGLEDTNPNIIQKIVSWIWEKLQALWDFITKFFNRVINFISKLIQKIKRFFKSRKITYNPENVKKLNEWLSSKELQVIPLKDCDGFLEFHKEILAHADIVIKKSVHGPTTLPQLIEEGIIKVPSNLTEKGREILLEGKLEKMDKVSGKDALSFSDNTKQINIDNIKDEKSTVQFYNDAVKFLEYQIELMEKKYNPIIEHAKKSNTEKIIKKTLQELGNNLDSKNMTSAVNSYLGIISFIIKLIQVNINRLIPFYNEFLRKFCQLFLNNEEAILLKYKDPDFIEKVLNSLRPFARIEEMDFYRASHLAKIGNEVGDTIAVASSELFDTNACCAICDLGTKTIGIVGEGLIKLLSKQELDAILGHEYGHYLNTHNTQNIITIMKSVLTGKDVEMPPRSLRQELEADSYGVQMTSPDAMMSSLLKLTKKFPTLLKNNDEIVLRLAYLREWKKTNKQPDLEEYLKKHNDPKYDMLTGEKK